MKKTLIVLILIINSITVFSQISVTVDSIRQKSDTLWISNRKGSITYMRTSGDSLYLGDVSGEMYLGLVNSGGSTTDTLNVKLVRFNSSIPIPDYIEGQSYYNSTLNTVVVQTPDGNKFMVDSTFNKDSIYVAGQNEWIFTGDTIWRVDTSNYSLFSAYAYNSDSTSVSYLADTIKITSNTSDPHKIYNQGTSNSILHIAEENEFAWIDLQGDELIIGQIRDINGNYLQINNGAYVHGLNDAKIDVDNNYVRVYDNNVDIYSETGIKIENNSSSDLTIITGDDVYFSDADIIAIDTADIKRAIIEVTETDTVESTNQIVVISQSNEYKFIGDTLFAEQEAGKFKYIEAKEASLVKIITDTNIIGGDTITGGMSLKDAVEAEQFAQINFKDTTFTAQSDGRLFYNENTKNLIFENDISDFEHNIGYELVKRVYNNSGSTITNGSIVRRTGTYVNGSRVPTVGLAGNGSADSSRVCGMATVDIPNNSYGIITIIGDVNFYNSSHLTENQFYLGHAGSTIDTSPPPPYYSVDLGCVIYSDNDSGIVAFHFRNPTLDPTPIISSDTSGWLKLVSVTQNIYTKFQISDFDLENNYGFTRLGDSIRCNVGGFVTIAMNTSYTGAVTSATWRKGIFLNGVNKHSVSRSTTSQAVGNSTVIKTLRVEVNDYISFRITNTTGNEDPTINDFSYQILYLHE